VPPTATPAGGGAGHEGVGLGASNLPVVAERRGEEVGEVVYAAARERELLMPDLRGRSVRDVARICARLGLGLEARGEGRALRQSPEVGAALAPGQTVRIEFGRSD
jgi:beta-lactam-binding protein with PASTA domain